jgi:hypothetical protein
MPSLFAIPARRPIQVYARVAGLLYLIIILIGLLGKSLIKSVDVPVWEQRAHHA